MTLRLRLVLALVVLSTAGLAVFGFATYSLYARSQYRRLDDQIQASTPLITNALLAQAGLAAPGDVRGEGQNGAGAAGNAHGGGPPAVVPPGTYGELRAGDSVLVRIQVMDNEVVPKIPARLGDVGENGRYFTVGSAQGSAEWRVYAATDPSIGGRTVVVATPMTEVSSALRRLTAIEAAAAATLLALLAVGAWIILRRGLRPLESMATSARSIAAGDLSLRVAPAEERTEVGQLGLALNTMLGEIEQAFRARAETEQRLRQFLADASHELRTPLTSIQGFAELFRIGPAEDRMELAVILRRIEEESARMRTLVEDLLLLARLDQTRPAERSPVDLAVLAADACSDAVATAPDRPITLDAPQPVVVVGDGHHLRQAIGNLVSNAVAHTPPGTPIEVGARVDGGDAAVVTVRDHGAGLDGEALAHAFDRFWRADPARAGSSAGLGLSIVAAIAEEHGGRAACANAMGGGARFELRLPVRQG
ncbi:MAG: HAMP domain-containing histidine kinase [Actinobacteria bacterium]|nr:HAMP domain-containing histidine kinase [Actinomycetota bacterium]